MTLQPSVQALFENDALPIIAGPCVIESYDLCARIADHAQEATARHQLPYIFKASFDKANRTSIHSYRGPGLDEGLAILERVKKECGVPVLTDIHLPEQAQPTAQVADILQIPAFLCRQSDLIIAAARTQKPVNIKKGQFMAPSDMGHVATKFKESGGTHLALTERGTFFGYGNLVVDFRSLDEMRQVSQAPIIFDATHSVQRPGSGDGTTGGDRKLAPILARAAVAVGVDGLFCEVHPNPAEAKSDGANCLDFPLFDTLLHQCAGLFKSHQALAIS
jgi:2-dehydro-3-deoxyphosphooctonate aldolase (KDO 8-P synthase)